MTDTTDTTDLAALRALDQAWTDLYDLVTYYAGDPVALARILRGLSEIADTADKAYRAAADVTEDLAFRAHPHGPIRHTYAPATAQDTAVAHLARQAAERLRQAARSASDQGWNADAAAAAVALLRPGPTSVTP